MQKIIFNDVQLSDMRTMSECFVRNNEELKLMPRLLGGFNGCSRADGADGEKIEAWSENGNADGRDG
ncbi:uncharacterized protein MONOS_16671 [Monocercomonoides exilis]|uniref:uncharacterized protein n=1 Tax=Monocercomonoides exilis TaxID=2049356 RepID=UPI00355A49F8|nr:hypothetical protein MONOS_16671 [Monocercomonoides exilis]|eukprot:MONOS_16671.1-p1 / transcript=MONOS_16671.1 / gene=MONOS_16671 / organism=Monocercomonoides_exilis_PA203 / gene_product=unspecified product / transcript_product=unspecified product / location=Mono_scaffold01989:1887-2087(+) / protein_length=67 / sequence_SO=supercontig / SO=protein_coding / is_pseudo=false